jgi:hypothetical protein
MFGPASVPQKASLPFAIYCLAAGLGSLCYLVLR